MDVIETAASSTLYEKRRKALNKLVKEINPFSIIYNVGSKFWRRSMSLVSESI